MLAKVPTKKQKSSFKRLINYITRHYNSSKPNSKNETLITNKGPELIITNNVACEHNSLSLETASEEMNAVALQNVRVKDPIYHFILCWQPHENPTDTQAFDCARYALKCLHMKNHQYISAIHRDTKSIHIHIAVNRVHPETLKAIYPKRDYFILDYAMRELELKYGWNHSNGPYAVFEINGKKMIDWASQKKNTQEKMPTPARHMEIYEDRESLFSYARGKPRKAILTLLKQENEFTWQDLHRLLATYNLEIKEQGQGLIVCDVTSQISIKASDMHEKMSKKNLVTLLGEYVPATNNSPIPLSNSYNALMPKKRNPEERDERRIMRAKQRAELKYRYIEYKNTFKAEKLDKVHIKFLYEQVRLRAKNKRLNIQNKIANPLTRKALYSILAFETAREKQAIGILVQQKIAELKQNPKRQSYKEWVIEQANNGDLCAESQIRGWNYAEKRKNKVQN